MISDLKSQLAPRSMMNGKPVYTRPAKTVINFDSAFGHKLLCDGPTFSAGDACVYSCAFCYVPDLIRKLRATPVMEGIEGRHEDIVIRRVGQEDLTGLDAGRLSTAQIARDQLHGRKDRFEVKTIYASPLVDVAGNMDLVRETVEICKVILNETRWDIRLLSKSNLLPKVAQLLEEWNENGAPRLRVIYGVSTGTLDDGLAKVFEEGAPLVSKRIQSLHWLQDNGFRTYGMVCPSLPQPPSGGTIRFAREMAAAIRSDRCEHVWAEVINLRGESFTRTVNALRAGGFEDQAARLEFVSRDKEAWERYARETFQAHQLALGPQGKKLRFLQYVTPSTRAWWEERAREGAVVL